MLNISLGHDKQSPPGTQNSYHDKINRNKNVYPKLAANWLSLKVDGQHTPLMSLWRLPWKQALREEDNTYYNSKL